MQSFWTLAANSVLLGIALAMDAFSVSLVNGMQEPDMKKSRMAKIAGVFGGFQTLMPLIGRKAGTLISGKATMLGGIILIGIGIEILVTHLV